MNDFDMKRGRRNNNPFNIRRSSNNWLGKISFDKSTDKQFEQFEDMDFGIRAGVLLLRNYIRNKLVLEPTARCILYRFAPSLENDLNCYFKYLVANGIDIDKEVKYPSMDFATLCCKIMWYESNVFYKEEYIYTIINKFKLF